jgi:hypothetical protein
MLIWGSKSRWEVKHVSHASSIVKEWFGTSHLDRLRYRYYRMQQEATYKFCNCNHDSFGKGKKCTDIITQEPVPISDLNSQAVCDRRVRCSVFFFFWKKKCVEQEKKWETNIMYNSKAYRTTLLFQARANVAMDVYHDAVLWSWNRKSSGVPEHMQVKSNDWELGHSRCGPASEWFIRDIYFFKKHWIIGTFLIKMTKK